MALKSFSKCYCGCGAYTSTSKGLTYSIFDHPGIGLFLYSGHGIKRVYEGTYNTMDNATEAAKKDWESVP